MKLKENHKILVAFCMVVICGIIVASTNFVNSIAGIDGGYLVRIFHIINMF